METKHTPGPWTILNETTGSVGADAPYKMTASVYGDHEECEPDERMLANARLIAAAPELLNAAVVALAVIAKQYVTKDGLDAAMMLKEAIAKATDEC